MSNWQDNYIIYEIYEINMWNLHPQNSKKRKFPLSQDRLSEYYYFLLPSHQTLLVFTLLS